MVFSMDLLASLSLRPWLLHTGFVVQDEDFLYKGP